jgi:hypothetical protein
MVHRQLFNALVELALQIVSLVLQFSGKAITPSAAIGAVSETGPT